MPSYREPPPPDIEVEEFRKTVHSRRSVRRFTEEAIPEAVIQDCLDLALLAPNSSNLQPWMFYRVRSPRLRPALVRACLDQNAAKTAAELIVVVARTATWQAHCAEMIRQWPHGTPPRIVEDYYRRRAFLQYGRLPLDPGGLLKRTLRNIAGWRRPVPRWPNSRADMRLWACKSTALAAQTLMLALRAHGYDSCPMEGFDEARVRRLLELPRDAFVVMVVAAGRRADNGVYHARLRFARERFIRDC